jgi:hypothetical protein
VILIAAGGYFQVASNLSSTAVAAMIASGGQFQVANNLSSTVVAVLTIAGLLAGAVGVSTSQYGRQSRKTLRESNADFKERNTELEAQKAALEDECKKKDEVILRQGKELDFLKELKSGAAAVEILQEYLDGQMTQLRHELPAAVAAAILLGEKPK